ncbi:MAG: glycoside hydrolase family 19 protein, partial [Synechococcales bacterium]|nr:glycoside hydrolase family 19 protein [Synechococcales bacterium]
TFIQQPPRPTNRKPYEGIYPDLPLDDARAKVARQLKQLVVGITDPTLQDIDRQVDDTLRVLLVKPDRPSDRDPYSGLFPAAKIPELTAAQLLEIAPHADPSQVEALYPHLIVTLLEYNISTKLRQAHFLAQLAHESGSFNYLEELASGEDYEYRDDLGNLYPGDGVRFKGRGLIQITGRTNYQDCGEDLGVDLIEEPTRLADNDLACLSAGWFWDTRNLNPIADQDDVDTITYRINGGYNGYEERVEFLAQAKEVLGI